jgi:hypothetical protein
MYEYAYWLLGSIEPEPLVVIANASDGAWVDELTPANVPEPPIQFFCVREGIFGAVLQPAGLVLFRSDLSAALRHLGVGEFSTYPARIRSAQSDEIVDHYEIIKIPRTTPLASVTTPAGCASLTVVSEAIGAVLVSTELRALLERRNIPGLGFSEPMFVAGAPAN